VRAACRGRRTAASSACSDRVAAGGIPAGLAPARSTSEGVVLAFVAYAFWAWSDAAVKLLGGGVPPLETTCIGALLCLPALPFMCGPGDRWTDAFRASSFAVWLGRGALAVVGGVGSVITFTRLPMPEAFSVLFLMPMFVTVLSRLVLHEAVNWRRWSAVGLGLVGVLVVLRPGFRAVGYGHLAAVICALAGAGTVVMLRALGESERPVSLFGAGLMGPIVASGIGAALTGLVMPTGREWLLLLGYGTLAGVAAVLFQVASRAAPAALLAPTQYSQMLWAIAFGAFVFAQAPDRLTYAGAAIIIASGTFTLIRERARRTPAADLRPAVHPQ
jgi:S-adenosylmethionine uptake transporter